MIVFNRHLSLLLLEICTKTVNISQVPFGSVAFMPGKLIHTNEIMVLLGDNWFAERSASQALEIAARRKKCTVINCMFMVMFIDDGGLVTDARNIA